MFGNEDNGNSSSIINAQDVNTLEDLTIHVVGAKTTELEDVSIWEILPLRLPRLRRMTVVFIGPQLRLFHNM